MAKDSNGANLVRVFVTRKMEPQKDEPGNCWCHGDKDPRKPGDPGFMIVSNSSREVIEICPTFYLEILTSGIGLHIGALKGQVTDYPLLNQVITKQAVGAAESEAG